MRLTSSSPPSGLRHLLEGLFPAEMLSLETLRHFENTDVSGLLSVGGLLLRFLSICRIALLRGLVILHATDAAASCVHDL